MPRALSSDTEMVYWWLWRLPWASAADIARFSFLQATAVKNVLTRGEKRGWLKSARLGRVFDAVDRYVVSNTGIEEMQARWDWEIFWWHTADGVRALARRLEVVEMAYFYLPLLWQSNLVRDRKCHVYQEWQEIAWQTGEPVMRAQLVETDWSNGGLFDFFWLQSGPFEAIGAYGDGGDNDSLLLLPVMWKGNFQKVSDIASVRRDMRRILKEDERWSKLPRDQAISGDYHPGLGRVCKPNGGV